MVGPEIDLIEEIKQTAKTIGKYKAITIRKNPTKPSVEEQSIAKWKFKLLTHQ